LRSCAYLLTVIKTATLRIFTSWKRCRIATGLLYLSIYNELTVTTKFHSSEGQYQHYSALGKAETFRCWNFKRRNQRKLQVSFFF